MQLLNDVKTWRTTNEMTRTADYTPAGRNYIAMGFHTDGPLKNTEDLFVFSKPSNIVKSS